MAMSDAIIEHVGQYRLVHLDDPSEEVRAARRAQVLDGTYFRSIRHGIDLVFDAAGERFECQNCGECWRFEQLTHPIDIMSRVEPGDVMPHGCCPECEAVCLVAAHQPSLKALLMALGNRLVVEHGFHPNADAMPSTRPIVMFTEWLNRTPEARAVLGVMGYKWETVS